MNMAQDTEARILLVSPREAAKMLSISERSLATYTARGDFPVVRIGRSVRYDVEVLRQWIREHSEKKSVTCRDSLLTKHKGEI